MTDTATKRESTQPAIKLTVHLSPRNILYINDRAKTENIQPSEMIDRIIDTSRTLYRSPVGTSHDDTDQVLDFGNCPACGESLTSEEHDRSETYGGRCHNCFEEYSN